MSFFFYDYETTGVDPKRDRILQFAGIRTDEEFNIISDPLNYYCKLSKEIIPNPEALLVTKILPSILSQEGKDEPEFLQLIYKEFAAPNTCVVGYNNIRFDDEFTRYAFYRNFYDPYAREWQNNNSRWDLIDIVRMCAALRPHGIVWPVNPNDNKSSFKLEDITKANGLLHDKAHDALSDVYATIEITRLLNQKQPKLFKYLLQCRKKDFVSGVVNLNCVLDNNIPVKNKLIVHSSRMISNDYYATSVFLPLIQNPNNHNEIITWDLRYDPDILLNLNNDCEYAKKLLYTQQSLLNENETRLQLKSIHLNKCPAVAPISTLDADSLIRLKLNLEEIITRAEKIIANKELWLDLLLNLYSEKVNFDKIDVEHELYHKFIPNSDRVLCNQVILNSDINSCKNLKNIESKFMDSRLRELLFRYRARNYYNTIDSDEIIKWQEYSEARLNNVTNIASIAKDEFIAKCLNLIADENLNSFDKELLKSWLCYYQ